MATLPIVSGAQCITTLRKVGYEISRQKGSHARLTASGRAPVTVPLHQELDRGTLRSILRIAEISAGEFVELLR
jgi:predicted RNA binding protein YcfA (HicA-like mRNA interferase family)